MDSNTFKSLYDFFTDTHVSEQVDSGNPMILDVTYTYKGVQYLIKGLHYRNEDVYVPEVQKTITKNMVLDISYHDWPADRDNTDDIIKDYVQMLADQSKKDFFEVFLAVLKDNINLSIQEGMSPQYGANILNNNHWHDVFIFIRKCFTDTDYVEALMQNPDTLKRISDSIMDRLIYQWVQSKKQTTVNAERRAFHGNYGYVRSLIDNIKKFKPHLVGKKMIDDLKKMLLSNKQIVLAGAPGTGKTYSAERIAEQIIKGDNKGGDMDMQYGFVQFHPSYDYSDFVDGFRPVKGGGSSAINFELRNGIFKDFCKKAGVIERILYRDENIQRSDLFAAIDPACEGLKKSEEIAGYWKKFINNLGPEINGMGIIEKLPYFVFIIDEVNRAELSKVFGEVMYSLEPDYRGKKGSVKTQYAGMQNKDTFFVDEDDDCFFVPTNVLIIGTMNDIDRSVEVFDFALRRRFGWHYFEVAVVMPIVLNNMLAGWVGDLNGLIKRANELNKTISEGDWGPTKNYEIGPSYFGKIELYKDDNDPYVLLWENHIQPLLWEYLRGTGREQDFINRCKDSFGL